MATEYTFKSFTQEQLARVRDIVEEETPIRTGTLRASIVITLIQPFGITISWNTSYAMLVNVRGISKGYQERARKRVQEYIASVLEPKDKKLQQELKDAPNVVQIKPNQLKTEMRDGKEVVIIDKRYRSAIDNPNVLQNPNDIFTRAKIAEDIKKSSPKLANVFSDLSNKEVLSSIRTGEVLTKEAGEWISTELKDFLLPQSSYSYTTGKLEDITGQKGSAIKFKKAEAITYIKMTKELFKSKAKLVNIARYNSYAMILNPDYVAHEYLKEKKVMRNITKKIVSPKGE